MTKKESRVTIKDVAKEANLSIATVSFVLNEKENQTIPDATRKKVIEAAKKLNYRPNRLAVSLVTHQTKIIGLVSPDTTNPFFADLCTSVETAAKSFGYNIILGNTQNNAQNDLEYLKAFIDIGVEGVVFAKASGSSEEDVNSLHMLKESNIPVIIVDRHIASENISSVMLDHKKGGYLATKYLMELGHTRIGCITGPLSLDSAVSRLEGYREALTDAGIVHDESLIVQGAYQYQDGENAFPILWKRGISAIFACNDMMAFGVYKAARKAGINIPNDLSVIGFDDVRYCDVMVPALTTIRQPVADIGAEAIRQLIDTIRTKSVSTGKVTLFTPSLIVRESCIDIREKS